MTEVAKTRFGYFHVKVRGTYRLEDVDTVGEAQERVQEALSALGDMGSQVSISLASICGRETDVKDMRLTCTKRLGHKGECWK